jgi:hypothetical protein
MAFRVASIRDLRNFGTLSRTSTGNVRTSLASSTSPFSSAGIFAKMTKVGETSNLVYKSEKFQTDGTSKRMDSSWSKKSAPNWVTGLTNLLFLLAAWLGISFRCY